MEINRSYTHKVYGAIGSVTFTAPKGKYILDGHELPESSVEHLLTFALQTLQDAYAGAKSTDEAKGAFNGKYDKLLNGTIGTRSGGDGVDERTRVARSVVYAALKVKFGAKSPEWAEFTGRDDDAIAARLDEIYAEHEATFAPRVDEEMAERAAKRARKADLAKAVEVTL